MSAKSYGLNYERKRKKMLQEQGFTTMRCRGSFGLFDIVGANKDIWLLENIKSTKMKYFSFKTEIAEVEKFDNAPIGTIKRLVLFHKGKMKVLCENKIEGERAKPRTTQGH